MLDSGFRTRVFEALLALVAPGPWPPHEPKFETRVYRQRKVAWRCGLATVVWDVSRFRFRPVLDLLFWRDVQC